MWVNSLIPTKYLYGNASTPAWALLHPFRDFRLLRSPQGKEAFVPLPQGKSQAATVGQLRPVSVLSWVKAHPRLQHDASLPGHSEFWGGFEDGWPGKGCRQLRKLAASLEMQWFHCHKVTAKKKSEHLLSMEKASPVSVDNGNHRYWTHGYRGMPVSLFNLDKVQFLTVHLLLCKMDFGCELALGFECITYLCYWIFFIVYYLWVLVMPKKVDSFIHSFILYQMKDCHWGDSVSLPTFKKTLPFTSCDWKEIHNVGCILTYT